MGMPEQNIRLNSEEYNPNDDYFDKIPIHESSRVPRNQSPKIARKQSSRSVDSPKLEKARPMDKYKQNVASCKSIRIRTMDIDDDGESGSGGDGHMPKNFQE